MPIYQIQSKFTIGLCTIWDAEYVSADNDATDFATIEEAEAAVEELVSQGGRNRADLRIREVA